jgi:hypothetical protein
MARASLKVRGLQEHPDHKRYKIARNLYAEAIRRAKTKHWANWLANLDDESLWTASRIATGSPHDGRTTRIPTLQVREEGTNRTIQEAQDNESKAEALYRLFFHPKREETTTPEDCKYPEAKWTHEPITNKQIDRAIQKMKLYKGTRPDTIPNCVFKMAREALVPHLGPLYRATDMLKWYPAEWKLTSTPVIRKPGRTDYTMPGAWRPVVLSDGYARLLNKCKTEELVANCERLEILPKNHFGGRPGRSTTDSVHLLIQIVKAAWRKGLVASILFLGVKGAFPSVDIERLIHNLRAKGVPKEHTEWMTRRLQGRHTRLTFDDFRSRMLEIDGGLNQGDPLSVISYLLYNVSFLECLHQERREQGALFVDDAYILTTGVDFKETHRKIKQIMERTGRVFNWARTHNCKFGVAKFQLLDLTRKLMPHPTTPRRKALMERLDLQLGNRIIKSAPCIIFLGVQIDRELRWREQGAHAIAKGQEWVARMGRMARVSRGVTSNYLRQLYMAVALPRILYAADIFLNPGPQRRGGNGGPDKGGRAIMTKLTAIQRKAAIVRATLAG